MTLIYNLLGTFDRFFDHGPQIKSRTFRKPNTKLNSIRCVHLDVLTPGFAEAFKIEFPEEFQKIIEEADKATELVLNINEVGLLDLKVFRERKDLMFQDQPARVHGRIPWHFDFNSKIGWDPHLHFSKISEKTATGNIQIPWNLSRCSYFSVLGKGYVLSQNQKYAQSFCNHVLDWIEQNPFKFGVNWVSPDEVAYRAMNWISAWDFFGNKSTISQEFENKFIGSLKEHGEYLTRWVKWGNPGFASLLGLLVLGSTLEEEKWTELSRSNITRSKFLGSGHDLLVFGLMQGEDNVGPTFKRKFRKIIQTDDNPWLGAMGSLFLKDTQLKRPVKKDVEASLVWYFGLSGLQTFRAMEVVSDRH